MGRGYEHLDQDDMLNWEGGKVFHESQSTNFFFCCLFIHMCIHSKTQISDPKLEWTLKFMSEPGKNDANYRK
jgi:hypothetical protein